VHPENQRKPSAVPRRATRKFPYLNKAWFFWLGNSFLGSSAI
jgi:hypothetical protein